MLCLYSIRYLCNNQDTHRSWAKDRKKCPLSQTHNTQHTYIYFMWSATARTPYHWFISILMWNNFLPSLNLNLISFFITELFITTHMSAVHVNALAVSFMNSMYTSILLYTSFVSKSIWNTHRLAYNFSVSQSISKFQSRPLIHLQQSNFPNYGF